MKEGAFLKDTKETQRIIKEYFENGYSNNLENYNR